MTKSKETKAAEKSKWKIPPARIPSDDCQVHVGRVIEDGEIKDPGTPYNVHVDEWVELLPSRSVTEVMALGDLANATPGSLRTLCQELSKRVVAWNWTGMDSS